MAKHALLSASGAHRWLECTPSALLELQFPQSTSEYAEEGTAAHELCELTARCFLGEVSEMDFENRRDELAKGPYYNAEMQECANDYARFVAEKTKAAQESCEDAFTELEVRVDFSKYVKDGFGKQVGRLAYMPLAYEHYMERKAREEQRANTENTSAYVGEVGTRLTLDLTAAVLLTSWYNDFGTTYLYKFADEAGNVFIWYASRPIELQERMTLKATIKAHNERNGVKQTVLTRCKVVA